MELSKSYEFGNLKSEFFNFIVNKNELSFQSEVGFIHLF